MGNSKESMHPQTTLLKEYLNPGSELFEFELWASAVKERMLLHFEKRRVPFRKRSRPKSNVII